MHQSQKVFFNFLLVLNMFFLLACTQNREENERNNSISVEQTTIARRKNRRNHQRRNNDVNSQEISSSLIPIEVLPQATDEAIADWLEPHYVLVDKSVKPQNKLFLFFSGSYGQPSRQQLLLQEAAQLGYHAINLSYPNSWTVGGLCGKSSDRDCYEKVRQEIIDGSDRSEEVNISRADSIENRLVKLLQYLHQQQPQEGWLNYLAGEKPRWESIVVAGHSQGGGQAAMIAKDNVVARVVMLAAPADYNKQANMPAPWLSAPHATPTERYYGFAHVDDRGFEQIQQAWKLLGMTKYGESVTVENQSPPYDNSHQLVTAATPARRKKFHGSVATDKNTPKLPDGTPVFEPVWQYLFDLDETK
jgi:hypothetical protein